MQNYKLQQLKDWLDGELKYRNDTITHFKLINKINEIMGYKNTDPFLQKAFDDERLFVLMTRDANAPIVVMEWIKHSLHNQPDEKLREAFECALEMKNRFTEIMDRKLNHKHPKET